MSLVEHYNTNVIQRMTTAVADIFRKITVITQSGEPGNRTEREYAVPFIVGPINKAFLDKKEGYSIDVDGNEVGQRYYQTWPRMALTPSTYTYAGARESSSNSIIELFPPMGIEVPESMASAMKVVPVDIGFTLHVKSHSYPILAQIIEQVMSQFRPNKVVEIQEFPHINIKRAFNLIFDGSTSPDWNIPKQTDDRWSEIETTFNFKAEGWFYPQFKMVDYVEFLELNVHLASEGAIDQGIIIYNREIDITSE